MTEQGDSSSRSAGRCKLAVTALAGLAVAVALTYRGSLDNDFHFDDKQHIHQNAAVRVEELSFEALSRAVSESPNARRPLPYISFAIDWWRGGGGPRSFQWTNVALHAMASFAAFGLVLAVLGRRRRGVEAASVAAAFAAAALWAIHPIQVQAVTYIVQRMALLAGLFTVLAVFAYIRGRSAVTGARRAAWLSLCLAAGLLGALSKQNAWVTPALLVLAELGVVRNDRALFRSRAEALALALLVALIAISFAAAVFGQGPLGSFATGYEARDFSLLDRLRTQPRVVLFHVSQIAWPLPSRFSLEHDFGVSTSLVDPISTLPALLAVLAWCAAGGWLLTRRGQRIVGFFVLWLPATLVIESTILPLEMVFEHRMYLPSVGLFGLLGVAFAGAFAGDRRSRLLLGVPLAFALVFLAAATTRYLAVWRDPISLAENTTRTAPRSARTWSNLALAYLNADRREEAEAALRRSMDIAPDDPHNIELLGVLLFDRGRLGEARVVFERALVLGPSPSLLSHLGEVELAEGDYAKAAALFLRAAEQKPWISTYHWNRAVALEGLLRCAEARSEWQIYLDLSSDADANAEVRAHLHEVHASPGGKCREG